jgi:hypothetical protein
MSRNPRTDPKEGDVLYRAEGAHEILVDNVDADYIYYRVTDGHGGLCGAYKVLLSTWKEILPYTCEVYQEEQEKE